MAEKQKKEIIVKEGTLPIDIRGKEAWDSDYGDRLPEGSYRMQVVGMAAPTKKFDGPAMFLHCKVLKGPNDTDDMKDNIHRELFWLSTKNKDGTGKGRVGRLLGVIKPLAPEFMDPKYAIEKRGRMEPRVDLVTGGNTGQGAVFDCKIKVTPYETTDKQGKKVTRERSEIMLGTVECIEPSSVLKQLRGQTTATADAAGDIWGTTPPDGGNSESTADNESMFGN